MKKITFLILTISFLFGANSLFAQRGTSQVGTTAAQFLKIPVGARSSAMSAVGATVNDVSAMFWNPGGLAMVEGNEVMLEYTDWFIDVRHNYFAVASELGKGVAGLHVVALTMDEFEETTIEAQGKTGRTFSAYSLSVGGSYAQYIIPNLSIGGTAKFIFEKIFDSSASTFAFDVGTIYETPFDGLKFGFTITNAGSKLQITGDNLIIPADVDPSGEGNRETDAELSTEEFDLPLMLRVGFAWDAYKTEQFRATLAVDGTSPTDNFQSVSVGGELGLLNEQLFIRGGVPYIGLEDKTEEFNLGLGVKYGLSQDLKVGFGYTFHKYDILNNVNKVSLQIYF